MLAYFNRHGARVRGGGGRGAREEGGDEKHKEVSERDISFFHTMCYCKLFISFAIPLLSPALCFSSPSLSVRTGWGSPGRIKSTGSCLYLGSISPNRFPKLWTVQSAAVVTRELSVVVLSRQNPLKMNMFDIWAWFCDWTKGTLLFIKSNLDRDLWLHVRFLDRLGLTVR